MHPRRVGNRRSRRARCQRRKCGGVRLEMVTISPKGLDVLDGFAGDIGVDVRF